MEGDSGQAHMQIRVKGPMQVEIPEGSTLEQVRAAGRGWAGVEWGWRSVQVQAVGIPVQEQGCVFQCRRRQSAFDRRSRQWAFQCRSTQSAFHSRSRQVWLQEVLK